MKCNLPGAYSKGRKTLNKKERSRLVKFLMERSFLSQHSSLSLFQDSEKMSKKS